MSGCFLAGKHAQGVLQIRPDALYLEVTSPQKQKGTPLVDVPLTVMIASATPYAGITQVRFEGYTLSLYGTPRIGYSVVVKPYSRVSPESSQFLARPG